MAAIGTNWLAIIGIPFSGLGGSAMTAWVAWRIHKRSQPQPSGHAWEILKSLNRVLGKQEGEVYFTKSAQDHYQVAAHIYSNANSHTIGTAFHEDPAMYGHADLVRNFQYGGSLFTRITYREVCSPESEVTARANLEEIQPGANLIVIPAGEMFVRFDGIFCRLQDDSHLCFLFVSQPQRPKAQQRRCVSRWNRQKLL